MTARLLDGKRVAQEIREEVKENAKPLIAKGVVPGLAAVLVPFPYAIDDHQSKNAAHLSRVGAARVIAEAELDAARLATELQGLLADRATLVGMAEAARAQATPDAARRIAEACLSAAEVAP